MSNYSKRYLFGTVLAIISATLMNIKCLAINESYGPTHVVSNYISNSTINAIAQDKFGRIWIATGRGLNRYEGNKYYQYFSSDSENTINDNEIKDIFVDSKNRLWVSTPFGVSFLKEDDTFQRIPQDGKSSQNGTFLETDDHKIYLVTEWEIMEYIEEANYLKTRRSFDVQRSYRFYKDNKGYIWGIVGDTLEKLDPETINILYKYTLPFLPSSSTITNDGKIILYGENRIASFDTASNQLSFPFGENLTNEMKDAAVSSMIQLVESIFLFSLNNNDYIIYNIENHSIIHKDDSNFPISVPKVSSSKIFKDSQDNLWYSARSSLMVWYNHSGAFGLYKSLNSFFKEKNIGGLGTFNNDELIISTNEGIFLFDERNESITKCIIKPNELNINDNSIRLSFCHIDKEGYIWASTKSRLCQFEISGNVLSLKNSYSTNGTLLTITEDDYGKIWAGTYYGEIICINKESNLKQIVKAYDGDERIIVSGLVNYNGNIVVGAYPYNIRVINPITFETSDLVSEDKFKSQVNGYYIPTSLFKDKHGNLWVGTNSNGAIRYNPQNGTFEKIPQTNHTNVLSYSEDSDGNIWIGTADGLMRYNIESKTIRKYSIEDGITSNQFSDRIVTTLNSGAIVFGSQSGLTIVNPKLANTERYIPIIFEDLKIINDLVNPNENGPISKSLVYNPKVTLKSSQKNFSISFTALDYSEFSYPDYSYKLEGYDKQWMNSGNINSVSYSNIKAGKYKFYVKIDDEFNGKTTSIASLDIRIKPALWASWWAILIYITLISALVYFILNSVRKVNKANEESKIAKLETEIEITRNKRNKSYFANVAHEFRAPLTMISGPIISLINNSKIQGKERTMLNIMNQNVNRMLELVNQFMDFNKLENDTLKLFVTKGDIVEYMKNYLMIFSLYAEQSAINFDTHFLEKSCRTYFDEDKLMKIVNNLLSNAFKYTPAGGDVIVSFDVITKKEAETQFPLSDKDISSSYARFSVTDSGTGIPEALFDKIFEQYYQIDDQARDKYAQGTGIGLYYAKALVEMHHGHIKVANRPTGDGAVFTFILPTDDNAYTKEEKNQDEKEQASIDLIRKSFSSFSYEDYDQAEYKASANAPKILIVDDDLELTNYLKMLLGSDYNIFGCNNVDDALKTLKDNKISLILSDIIMPIKSGFSLCEEVKKDPKLKNIPIILLTAKATVESQIEALDKGADALVTKPFDPSYLLTLIKSTLAKKESQKDGEANELIVEERENDLSPADSALLKKVYEIMEQELANPDFDVDSILEHVRMSRSKLYYKIKDLTGETPNELFKKYKLNKAADLLLNEHYSIAEVSEMTGFTTSSYFSVLFKKQFGVSPSQYVNSKL